MPNPIGGVTPNRTAKLTLDYAETVPTEQVFLLEKKGEQMKPTAKSGVIRLASGVWILEPVNSWNLQHETTIAQAEVVRKADLDTAGHIAEVAMQKSPATELTGLTTGSLLSTTGDHHLTKRVTAAATWNQTVTPEIPAPTLTDPNLTVDCIAKGKALHDPMTGYFVKIKLPNGSIGIPDWCASFEFGGHVSGQGYGRFHLRFSGDGRCRLYEHKNGAWGEPVAEWRYGTPGQGAGDNIIFMRIIPHFPRFIEFQSGMGGSGDNLYELLARMAVLAIKTATGDQAPVSTYLHDVGDRGGIQREGGGATDNYFRAITGQGRVHLFLRRDLRGYMQVSRIAYSTTSNSGTITDDAFQVPYGFGSGAGHILRAKERGLHWYSAGTQKTAMSVTLQNSDGSALTSASENYTHGGTTYPLTGWATPGGNNYLRAYVQMGTTDKYHTPFFYGYAAFRNGHTEEITPGDAKIVRDLADDATLKGISITGPTYLPDGESAEFVITDPKDNLELLRTRARQTVKLETTYDAANPTKTSILFEGYVGKAIAERKGSDDTGFLFPDPEWREYTLSCLNKWDRLQNRFFHLNPNFGDDGTSPSRSLTSVNKQQAWKVTDVIRYILHTEGFSEDQLDIPDEDIRLFSSSKDQNSELFKPMPGSSIPDYLHMLARDFLNGYLVWCPNAGTHGKWRLLKPPTKDTAVAWNFVTAKPGVANKMAHMSASYAASTSPIFRMTTWVVPPEGNVLTVSGGNIKGTGRRGQSVWYNPKSWSKPGESTADASSLDYIGRIIPIEYVDTTLESQESLNFIGRRVYMAACFGQKHAEFDSELVLLNAATGEPTHYSTDADRHSHRPLRAGDVVTINAEKWVIHTANPYFTKSHVMRAHYEAQLFRTDIPEHVIVRN